MRERAMYMHLDPCVETLDVITSQQDWEETYEDFKSEVEINLQRVVFCARSKPIENCL